MGHHPHKGGKGNKKTKDNILTKSLKHYFSHNSENLTPHMYISGRFIQQPPNYGFVKPWLQNQEPPWGTHLLKIYEMCQYLSAAQIFYRPPHFFQPQYWATSSRKKAKTHNPTRKLWGESARSLDNRLLTAKPEEGLFTTDPLLIPWSNEISGLCYTAMQH